MRSEPVDVRPADAPTPAPRSASAPLPAQAAVRTGFWPGGAIICAIVLLAGFTPVAAKDALAEVPPITMGAVRFAIAATLLALTHCIRGPLSPAARRPIEKRDYPALILAAVLCVPVNQVCYLVGLKLTNVSHGALFYALNPVIVFLLSLLLGRTLWSLRMGAATALAFGGAAVLGWESLGFHASAGFLAGDLLLLGAVTSWAVYSIVSVPLTARYGPVRTLTIVMVIGAALYLPAMLVDMDDFDWNRLTWRGVFGFAFITVGTSYFNYMLWFIALGLMDLNRLSIAGNAAPLVGVFFAFVWRHEPLTLWLAAGGTLILSAITLANWDRLRALVAPRRGRDRVPPEAKKNG